MLEVTEATLAEFKKHDVAVLDIWAPWCGPCKAIAPVLEEMAKEKTNVKFGKLNADDNESFVADQEIQGIPTLIVFKKGKEAGRIIGFPGKDALKTKLERVLAN